MKLARFEAGEGQRVGLVVDGGLIDVRRVGGPSWTMLDIIAQAPTADSDDAAHSFRDDAAQRSALMPPI